METPALQIVQFQKMALNSAEAAAALSISVATLYKLVALGKITPTEEGQFAVTELQRYLDESTKANRKKKGVKC